MCVVSIGVIIIMKQIMMRHLMQPPKKRYYATHFPPICFSASTASSLLRPLANSDSASDLPTDFFKKLITTVSFDFAAMSPKIIAIEVEIDYLWVVIDDDDDSIKLFWDCRCFMSHRSPLDRSA